MTKEKMFFREENAGGEGGGEGERGAAVFEEPGAAHVEKEVVVEDKPAGGFDAEAFSKTFADTIKPMFESRQQQEEPKLTPEEAKKLLKVWEPDDEFIKEFGNLETQKAAIIKMRDGLLAQFDTLSQYRLQELQKQVEGKFNPAVDFITRHEAEQRQARFDAKYEALAKPELRGLLTAVADGLAKEKPNYKSEAEAFDALAKAVESVIQQSQPDFKLSAGSTPAKPAEKTRPNNGIPVITSGSGGGGGGNRTSAPAKPRGQAIFDK